MESADYTLKYAINRALELKKRLYVRPPTLPIKVQLISFKNGHPKIVSSLWISHILIGCMLYILMIILLPNAAMRPNQSTDMSHTWNPFFNYLSSMKLSGEYLFESQNKGIDIKTIQNQCRHQSLEQTDIYLKSLGLNVNLAINKMPEL